MVQEFLLVSYLLSTDEKIKQMLTYENWSDFIDQLNYVCNRRYQLPAINKPALGMRIWIQSSVIAVLTLFCALVWLASQLAEELAGKKARESLFWNREEEDAGPSLELEKWMNQFHILSVFVENIDNVFSPILVLTMFLKAIRFSEHFFRTLIFLIKDPSWIAFLHWIPNRGILMLTDSISLFMIVFVSQQLGKKVINNSRLCFPFLFLIESLKTFLTTYI